MYCEFHDLLPQAHPYVINYNQFRQIFGTANVMTPDLEVKRGDIFNAATLNKIRYIHRQLDLMDGVDHDLIDSITGTNARKLITTSGGLIISWPLPPDNIPTSAVELARLKHDVLHSQAYRVLVAQNGKSALITAGFNEGRVDYGEIHQQLERIRRTVEDDNTLLYATGEPVLKAWCWFYESDLARIFAVTGLFIIGTLIL
jgi:hypothetical protein